MKKFQTLMIVAALSFGFVQGVSAGGKKSPTSQHQGSPSTSSSPSSLGAAGHGASIWIQRGDGGISCEGEKAQSLDEGAQELKKSGVTVLDSQKGTDGNMHIQMCGAPTGTQNRFLIPKDELEKAKALGFMQVKANQ